MENILLTGGTGNLGKTVVESLFDSSRHLHLSVRNSVYGNSNNITYYETDLASAGKADSFLNEVIAKSGAINVAVFLAGGFEAGKVATTSIDDICKMIKLNFSTAFNIAHKLIGHFNANGGGKLIFIGAASAMDFASAADSLAYSLSKQLLYNFSKIINESGKDHRITSHILLPETIGRAGVGVLNDEDTKLTSPDCIANVINDIIKGKDTRTVVDFSTNSKNGK